MATMRVVQVPRPNGPFEIVERPIPEPAVGSVRIKVQACGICHSDSVTKEGAFPGIQYPRVPGHEVAGGIDAVGFPSMEPCSTRRLAADSCSVISLAFSRQASGRVVRGSCS